MAKHVVRRGECMQQLATRHGISAEELQQSNADLSQRRADPYVLCPGDIVEVADRERARHALSAGATNAFRANVPTHRLRVTVQSPEGPRRNAAFRFVVAGRPPREGTTDADGIAEIDVPSLARSGVLVFEGEHPVEVELRFGDLDPCDEVSGAQQRLRNIGHDCGRVDGRIGPRTRFALRAFQAEEGIEETGELCERTAAALRRRHGS